MREVKMTYPNGKVIFVKMSDAQIAKLVEDRKLGCLVISEFEIIG